MPEKAIKWGQIQGDLIPALVFYSIIVASQSVRRHTIVEPLSQRFYTVCYLQQQIHSSNLTNKI